jgi:uncharacterized protein YbaP (TraB family)
MKFLIFFLFTAFISLAYSQVVDVNKQLLWEISGNGLKEKSYLFGTLHSNDKRIFDLSDSVYYALDKANLIILEADIFELFKDIDSREDLPNTLYDKDGKAYTASEIASRTTYGDENGMPQFIDALLEEYCHNANKKFFALEDVKDQLNLGAKLNFTKRIFINDAFNDFSNQKLIELYLKGDITAIERFIRANLSADKEQFAALITDRNNKMAHKLDSILKKKESFFCAIGAGHLAGSEGVINLLRTRGFRLRPMLWTRSENKTLAKKKINSFRSYTYKDLASGLNANFHGKPFSEKNTDGSLSLIYREYGQGNSYIIDIVPNDSTLSFEQIATIYIASPPDINFNKKILDDGTLLFEGLSDTYPEGLNWVRIIFSEKHFAVLKTYGGNKFMHSDRPKKFFDNVWFE